MLHDSQLALFFFFTSWISINSSASIVTTEDKEQHSKISGSFDLKKKRYKPECMKTSGGKLIMTPKTDLLIIICLTVGGRKIKVAQLKMLTIQSAA